jgi:hypothetical protein
MNYDSQYQDHVDALRDKETTEDRLTREALHPKSEMLDARGRERRGHGGDMTPEEMAVLAEKANATTAETGFDRMLKEKMKDPTWAAGFLRARARLVRP